MLQNEERQVAAALQAVNIMELQQTEQIKKLASISLLRLLLQHGGTNYLHENPKSEVLLSSETAWLLNADSQADYYNGSAGEEMQERMFCKGSMEAHGLPLYELGSNIGINYAEGNMNNQNFVGLISTQSSNIIKDSVRSGNGASTSNDIIPFNFLQYGAQSSAGRVQELDNIPNRSPNQYWENGDNKADSNYMMNQNGQNDHNKADPYSMNDVTSRSWNQQDAPSSTARSWSILLNNQASPDSCSFGDQKNSLSLINYLHDTASDANADQQMRQSSKFLRVNCSIDRDKVEPQPLRGQANLFYPEYGWKILPGSYSSPTGYSVSNGGVLRTSKYLRAAQQLLEEGWTVKSCTQYRSGVGTSISHDPASTCRKQVRMNSDERCRLQMKKARLIDMVEELDRRYQEYKDQMQLLVTSFESATGNMGSAAPYTGFVKKLISRQFKALRDAIGEQIHGACRLLGEDISSIPVLNKGETPRLRILDERLRHHQALQEASTLSQYHQGSRRRHSLPERSVAVLRAWLFEHFLDPYPNDSEKQMLARLTGLTKSQVAHWFINARVRLWKPMVEQMYAEEMKEDQSENGANQAGAERIYEDIAVNLDEVTKNSEQSSIVRKHELAPTLRMH